MLCRERLPQAIRAAMVFGGAFAGVLVVLAHCWFVSGHLTQSSAQQKLMWSAAVGHSFEFSADLLRFVEPVRLAEHWMLLHHHPTYRVTQLMILLLCVPPLAYAWPRRGSVRTAFPLISASVLTLLGYVVFYHWDSYSIQIWYTANILLPVAVLLVCDVWLLGRLLGPTAVALPVTLAVFGLFAAATPAWPDQERLLDAAIYLREHPPAGPVAAWNAGVLSVVSGNADLINLDGLVNDQIHPYAEQGRLAIYLQQRGVRTVVDYQNQFTSTIISGMPLEQVDRCFGPPQVLSFHHENGWGVWPSVVVLRPVLACAAGR